MHLSTFYKNFSLIALTVLLSTVFNLSAESLKEYSFNVGDFKVLKIQDNVNVVYHCSDNGTSMVKYKSTPEFDDAFILTNTGRTLKIQVNTEDVDKPGLPTLHIYSGRLSKVENYSDFNLSISDPCDSDQFTASLIGNGTITITGLNVQTLTASITAGNGTINITGSAEKATFRMTGTGRIDAEKLKASDVSCKIFGGGTIICGPERSLKSIGIGSTKIHYHGSPKISHSGGGKLIPLDKTDADGTT